MVKPKKSVSKTKKTTPASAPDDDLALSVGAQRAYDLFLPLAEALDPKATTPFRADAHLALRNVNVGVESLLAERLRITKELPALSLDDVRSLPSLALAVVFAAAQVDRGASASTGEIGAMLKRAAELRMLLLTAASSLVLAGLLPARTVEAIRAGHGAIDAAKDCIQLAALYRAHPAAAKKTVVTAAQLREAAEIGAALLAVLQPRRGTRTARSPESVVDAAATRDRLWSLLVQRHDRARRAGTWLFGKDVDIRVPALGAYGQAAKKATKKPAKLEAETEATS